MPREYRGPVNPLDRLQTYRRRDERRALGLMSGMSMDGLDLALIRVRDRSPGPGVDVTLDAHATVAYPAELSARMRAAVRGTTRDVCTLSFDLAATWATMVLAFLADAGVDAEAVGVLGSHGQTLDHVPRERDATPSTLQVGDGDVLAHATGIPTVSDFRSRDIAAGGEGAPLVPYADWLLYARPGATLACQNLGNIANVTVVTERLEDVKAFDTGPANALIDAYARMATGRDDGIDEDGRISATGRVDAALLEDLQRRRRDFFDRAPPKSAGYDEFGAEFAAEVASAHPRVSASDRVRTAVELTAQSLADAYGRWVLPGAATPLRHVRVTGGGAKNPTLVGRIRHHLAPWGLEVVVPDGAWVDAKEAVAFALLADATLCGRPSNVTGATGAAQPVVLGKISL